MVSLGNQVDVCEADMLVPVAEDVYTNVLALYLEGVKHGRSFVEQARMVTTKKPVFITASELWAHRRGHGW